MGVRFLKWKYRKNFWNSHLHYKSRLAPESPKVWCLAWLCLLCLAGYVCSSLRYFKSGRQSVGSVSDTAQLKTFSSRHLLEEASTYEIVWFPNCTSKNTSISGSHGIQWESCDFENDSGLSGGWICLHIFCTLISFIAIAIICDDFFVPSLEAICEKLDLSEDVAGATFMAAGSSAPELFSSVAAVTFESEMGVGTIVGSAVFNLLVIIALTAAFAGELNLDWRPLLRDSVFYAVSIGWFIYSVWDTLIQIWEPVVMLVLYILYIVVMKFNPKLMDALAKCTNQEVEPKEEEDTTDGEHLKVPNGDARRKSSVLSVDKNYYVHNRRNSILLGIANVGHHHKEVDAPDGSTKPKKNDKNVVIDLMPSPVNKSPVTSQSMYDDPNAFADTRKIDMKEIKEERKEQEKKKKEGKSDDDKDKSESEEEDEELSPRIECCECCSCCPAIRGHPPKREDLDAELEEKETQCQRCWAWNLFNLKWVIFIFAFPFLCLFSWTIPDCARKKYRKWYMVSFFVSVIWIAAISFAMVTSVARLGCILGVDQFVMSLVILAAGTSIPDLISSIVVAKDGFGDMAVSNAIGSNVFDINLGLGLPFFIRICITAIEPINFLSNQERQVWCQGNLPLLPHAKFGFILLLLLIIALLSFKCVKFKLTKGIGIGFFLLYIIFLVYAFLQEYLCAKPGNYLC